MIEMHPIIKKGVQDIKETLLQRGFPEPNVIEGPDVRVKTHTDIHYFATKRPIIVELEPTRYHIKVELAKHEVLTGMPAFSPYSWWAVLLDPDNTDISYIEHISENIFQWLLQRSYKGYVLIKVPTLTTYGTVEAWYQKLFFLYIIKDGKHLEEVTDKVLDFLPWPFK